jgi:phage gp46-like protein
MADITTITSSNGDSDWAVSGAALQSGGDLVTAILISLFTDAQAANDDVIPDGSSDRRGWWGNLQMGSKLWLLARAKQTDETLAQAQEYATDALAWLIEDGVASAVTVKAFWKARSFLVLVVQITRTDGSTPLLAYAWAWDTGGNPVVLPTTGSTGMLDFSDQNNSAYRELI